MEVNVNGNVTLTIQPSDSLIALFGGLMGSGAASPKPTETVKPTAPPKTKTVKIEEKPAADTPQVDSPPVSETPALTTAAAEPEADVKKYTLEEVKAKVTSYLGTNDGSDAFTARRNNVLALNTEFGGAMTTIFDKLTPAKIAEYVDRVNALS